MTSVDDRKPTRGAGRGPTVEGVRRRAVVAMAGALALAGCSGSFCSAVGCFSVVDVQLDTATATFSPGPATAQLCLDQDCVTQAVSLGSGAPVRVGITPPSPPGSPESLTLPVRLRLLRGSEVLLERTAEATLTRNAPNGEQCGPICYSAALTLTA